MRIHLHGPSSARAAGLAGFVLAACAWACASGCATGDGMRFQVISMERPPDGVGLPPPADYTPCYTGVAKAYDTDGDGRADRIKVSIDGKDRCYGEDTNHNGRVDTWDVLDEQGRLTKRAHDADEDGKVDQAWTFDPARKGCASVALDRDRDGVIDTTGAVDVCQPLPSPPPPPLPPVGGPIGPSSPSR